MKQIIVKKTHSRRQFISNLIGAGIIINLPFINSCEISNNTDILNKRQKEIVTFVLNFLWPDNKNGPNIKDINVYSYLLWILSDNYIDPEENQYILNGIKWVDETAMEDFEMHFEKLSEKKKFRLIKNIMRIEWGESWMSRMLSIIIEAMFADPIYGSNPKGIVWEWFNHNPGQPRPDENNKYPIIMNRKHENIIVSNISQL